MSREHNDFYRFRTGYLKFKSALCDRNTGLLAYPLILDDVRRFFEHHDKVAVMVLRVADLERVESVYGWQACDEVLRRMAETLRDSVRRRLGTGTLLAEDGVHLGRFVSFVPATTEGAEVTALWAASTAEDLQADMEEAFAADEFRSMAGGLSFSTGSRLLSDNSFFRFERLVGHAIDGALPATSDPPAGRDDLEVEMRRILRDGDLRVDYEPVVTLPERQVMGYVALVRGPVGTHLETPAQLLTYGEQFGLSRDLDHLCRRRALESARALGGDQVLFISCLPSFLGDVAAADRGLSELMAHTGCPPERLILEVAEGHLENGGQPSAGAMEQLRRLGIRLAMGRAGTGFATLKLIEELQPEYVKIEPALVRGLDGNLVQQEVARSLVKVARIVGSQVVASGVESEAEADMVRRCGIVLAQGRHLARPQPSPGPQSPEKPVRGVHKD